MYGIIPNLLNHGELYSYSLTSVLSYEFSPKLSPQTPYYPNVSSVKAALSPMQVNPFTKFEWNLSLILVLLKNQGTINPRSADDYKYKF